MRSWFKLWPNEANIVRSVKYGDRSSGLSSFYINLQILSLVTLNTLINLKIILSFNPLNAELNPICHLLALLGGATIVVVSRLRVKAENNFIESNLLSDTPKHRIASVN